MARLEGSQKQYGFWVKFAVISLIIIQFTQAFASPALANIQMSFPEVDTTIIQQIIALPSMLMVFSSLFCGRLCKWIGYRKTSWIGIALSLLGGFMPALMHSSIGVILFWRAVFGLGYGLVFALCIAMIGVLWQGKEQKTMFGVMTGVGALFAMAYSTLSGLLTEISWTYVFWAYLIIIPFAIVIIAKLPEPAKTQITQDQAKPKKKLNFASFGAFYFVFVVLAGLAGIFFAAFMSNVAMVIIGGEIGTPTDIGVTMTWFSLGLAVGGFLYGPVKRLAGRFMLAITLAIFAIALLIFVTTGSLLVVMITATIYGVAFGAVNAECEACSVNTVADPAARADGASIFIAFGGVGAFIGPFVLAFAAGIAGFTGPTYQLDVAWIVLAAAAVVLFVIGFIRKRDPATPKFTVEQVEALEE